MQYTNIVTNLALTPFYFRLDFLFISFSCSIRLIGEFQSRFIIVLYSFFCFSLLWHFFNHIMSRFFFLVFSSVFYIFWSHPLRSSTSIYISFSYQLFLLSDFQLLSMFDKTLQCVMCWLRHIQCKFDLFCCSYEMVPV